jgi:hypothetical protein
MELKKHSRARSARPGPYTFDFRVRGEDFRVSYDSDSRDLFKEEKFLRAAPVAEYAGTDKRLMPGVQELLTALNARNDVYLGLLTGNWRKSGYLKLAVFGLDRFFTFGAFSDDSEIRPDLLPYAVRRFQLKYNRKPEPQDILCPRRHAQRYSMRQTSRRVSWLWLRHYKKKISYLSQPIKY